MIASPGPAAVDLLPQALQPLSPSGYACPLPAAGAERLGLEAQVGDEVGGDLRDVASSSCVCTPFDGSTVTGGRAVAGEPRRRRAASGRAGGRRARAPPANTTVAPSASAPSAGAAGRCRRLQPRHEQLGERPDRADDGERAEQRDLVQNSVDIGAIRNTASSATETA